MSNSSNPQPDDEPRNAREELLQRAVKRMTRLKPLVLDGVVYDKAYVDGLRQPLLAVRDCLIEGGKLPFANSLSEIHAVLCYYMEHVER